jgi:hypothetical protein
MPESEDTIPLGLLIEELDGLSGAGDTILVPFVEEALRLLVWDDDKRTVLLDRLEEAVEVLRFVFVDEVESLVLDDRVDEVLITGFVEDDDSLTVDLVDFDEVLVAEDELFEVDEGTGLFKKHLQACRTAGTFQSGMGESVLGLVQHYQKDVVIDPYGKNLP